MNRTLEKRMYMSRTLVTLVASVLAAWPAGPARAQSESAKIGVFDAQRVSEETEEGKRIQAKLNAFGEAKKAEISTKEKDLADKQNQLNSQALSLSAEKRAGLEKEIQRKVLELNQARETATREMQIEVAEAQNRFQEQLLGVIRDFGRDEGFVLIIERSLVAYAHEGVDVTTAIVDRFNKTYKAEPTPAPKEGG